MPRHGKRRPRPARCGIQELTQPLAGSFGMKTATGALVTSVEKDSPGARPVSSPATSSLKLDGKAIERSGELRGAIAETKPGTRATLELWRDGATKEVAVTVGEAKDAKAAEAASRAAEAQGKLGVAVRPLSAEERKEIGGKEGLVVESVSGPAEKAGIQRGRCDSCGERHAGEVGRRASRPRGCGRQVDRRPRATRRCADLRAGELRLSSCRIPSGGDST